MLHIFKKTGFHSKDRLELAKNRNFPQLNENDGGGDLVNYSHAIAMNSKMV